MRKPFNGDYILTQGFGENPDKYTQFGLKGHNGLDYGLPTGTIVVAPHAGRVIEATNDPTGYGNYIKIENDKEGSVLAHLLSFLVNVGDAVSEGQQIASSNNTGDSTGPHLHWGYYLFPRDRQNGYNGFIDQLSLLTPVTPLDPLQECLKQHDALVALCDQKDAQIKSLQDTVNSLNSIIKEKNTTIVNLQNQINNLINDNLNKDTRIQSLIEQAKKIPDLEKIIQQQESDRANYLAENQSLKQSVSQLQRRLDEKIPSGFLNRVFFLLGR
jgi:septal ring factor EnvC (AmiA/AmiB activator)